MSPLLTLAIKVLDLSFPKPKDCGTHYLSSPTYSVDYGTSFPSLPYQILTRTLTKLLLSGQVDLSKFRPNIIHFPSLRTLEMFSVVKGRQFMNATVAPKLVRFNYVSSDAPSTKLKGIGSKFINVHHLCYSHSSGRMYGPDLGYCDALTLCRAFPDVHHVEVKGEELAYLFGPLSYNSDPGSFSQRPIELLTGLKSLALNFLQSDWLKSLLDWLVNRRALGLPQLHIKLKGVPSKLGLCGGLLQN